MEKGSSISGISCGMETTGWRQAKRGLCARRYRFSESSILSESLPLVTVIIPTYNRFKYLLNALESVKNQTYKNIETIIVNDGSSEKEYYTHKFPVKVIHLKQNSKDKFGYPCVAHVINIGFLNANGKYIAFLDDDDLWFPQKIELQVQAMQNTGCKMCCTDGLIGYGIYNKNNAYKKYNQEHYFSTLQCIYKNANSSFLDKGFPDIWKLNDIEIHNCVIASSVLLDKEIINLIGPQREIKMGGDWVNGKKVYIDYDYWLRALEHTDCVYLKDICFYYDQGHGNGPCY